MKGKLDFKVEKIGGVIDINKKIKKMKGREWIRKDGIDNE